MEIFFQLMPCQKEPSYPTAKVKSETEAHSPELQAHQPSSSVTPMTEERPESDSHPELERPLSDHAELWLESSPEDREPISHSSRLPTPGSKPEERERTGQELEVLQ